MAPTAFLLFLVMTLLPMVTASDYQWVSSTGSDPCIRREIQLAPNTTHRITAEGWLDGCQWIIVADSGQPLLAIIRVAPPRSQIYVCPILNDLESGCVFVKAGPVGDATRHIPSSTSALKIVAYVKRAGSLVIDVLEFPKTECAENQFACPSGLDCPDDESKVCDGRRDCLAGGDELGCGYCDKSQINCSTHRCISSEYACDDWLDCLGPWDHTVEFQCEPCGETFVDFTRGAQSPVIMTSPGWPYARDPDRVTCVWKLIAEEGHRIVLRFTEIILYSSGDYLQFSNDHGWEDVFMSLPSYGQSRAANLHIIDSFPLLVESLNEVMSIKYTSNNEWREAGFEIEVEQSMAGTVSCGADQITCTMENLVCVRNDSTEETYGYCFRACGGIFYLSEAAYYNLTSPIYPRVYRPNLDCKWKVVAAPRHPSVQITVVDFYTEPDRDILSLTGGTLHGGEGMTFDLDGRTKLRTIVFNSAVVTILFRTDGTVSFPGFYLHVARHSSASNTLCPVANLFDCGDGSCVASDAECDGFRDCQTNGLDERDCVNVTCPGFYHCNGSKTCIRWSLVCDSNPDCPDADDETDEKCEERCPQGCACWTGRGREVHVACNDSWTESTVGNLVRKVHHLEFTNGNISSLPEGLFKGLKYLKTLSVTNSSINRLAPGVFDGLDSVTYLDFSANDISTIEGGTFRGLLRLKTMIASDIPLKTIKSGAFDGLGSLSTLVLIRGSKSSETPVDVEENAVTDLVGLSQLYVDYYLLCCEFVTAIARLSDTDCKTTERQPPLNLCGSLMRNSLLRVSMWCLGISAMLGNLIVIIWRLSGRDKGGKKTHSFFVLNLAVSDFMMGVYMVAIATADVYFGEDYSHVADEWRSSAICKLVGVISVLSSEASVFFVTLISLDCFFGIALPFSRVKLQKKCANVLAVVIWVCSVGLSVGPTVFVGDDSEIYGLSDVCIGLPLLTKPTSFVIEESYIDSSNETATISIPVGKGREPAWLYSIVLFLGVNLLCFLVILCCYTGIFISVKRTGRKVRRSSKRDNEIKMAVKMALIVGTDFACWMPVIFMGILSQTGLVDIGPDMYAWIVVFILPINSSLNPFLYTFYTTVTARLQSKTAKPDDNLNMKVKPSR